MAILHITFSLATQGSLKFAIRQHHLQRNETVLSVHDDFSIGPLQHLEERKTWLNTHIFKDNEDQQLYDDMYENWMKKSQVYLVIWMYGFGIVKTHTNKLACAM